MKSYRITVNGNVYDVSVEELNNAPTTASGLVPGLVPGPVPAPLSAPQAPTASAASNKPKAPASGTKLNCPMAGVVLDIKVSVGEAVKKHQVAIILESMKMENEIVTPAEGKISSILVSKGANVSAGDVLLTIE